MAAANLNAATGSIIGRIFFSSWKTGVAQTLYTGSWSGVYISPLDDVDAIASSQIGMTMRQFRALASGTRNRMRTAVRSYYGIYDQYGGADKVPGLPYWNFVRSGSYVSTMYSKRKGSDGLKIGSFDADLIEGLIPELSSSGVSQARKDAITAAYKNAQTAMGWDKTKTAEWGKTFRRERSNLIETNFNDMVRHRNNGASVDATLRAIVKGTS
jgi:hypothetical protein